MRLVVERLGLLLCIWICSVPPAHAANCVYFGDDIPALTLSLGANNLYNNLSVDLAIATNRVTALKLFYASGGQQYAVDLPPVSVTPPNQTYTVTNIKTTTTFIVVGKRGTSATVCTLSVPYNIPVDNQAGPPNTECPQGHAFAGWGPGWQGTGYPTNYCVRVLPPYDTTNYPDYRGDVAPPYGHACKAGGYFVGDFGNGSPMTCRTDNWTASNPITNSTTFGAGPGHNCNPYGVPGKVSFLVAIHPGPNYQCATRSLEILGDPAADQTAAANANTYAHS
jgi:hypothetical protein